MNRIRYLPTGGQRAICFLSFLLALYRVINSLLLWEKVAAVRLTDEESLLVGTPHPPLSRSPFPHWGRLFLYPESPSVFLDNHCICGHKCKIRHTSFEIYRILENYPLGYAPNSAVFLFHKIKFKIIHAYGVAIFYALYFKLFKYTCIFKHLLEIHQRFIIIKVN